MKMISDKEKMLVQTATQIYLFSLKMACDQLQEGETISTSALMVDAYLEAVELIETCLDGNH